MTRVWIRDLIVRYASGFTLSIDELYFEDRQTNCVIGPNGAGKSTLLRAIANLVDYTGTIYIDSSDQRIDKKEFYKYVSYVSDIEPSALRVRVRDALLAARYPRSKTFFYTKRDFEVVDKISSALGVSEYYDRFLDELSSGELQLVLIAMSLVKEPIVLLLDEPDTHLDLKNKAKVGALIKSLSRNILTIVSTHDLLFASNMCDRIVVLFNGFVAADSAREDIENLVEKIGKIFGTNIRLMNKGGRTVLIPDYD
ncbi:ABC transporter ATP-binding protein [Thermogladius sp. 4427co]|uniref:ABC transporter ATP-binding protein n=1 Tax=Thermogladius sp. 4427co TaxID=3450718 RepID=UPI003F79BA7A